MGYVERTEKPSDTWTYWSTMFVGGISFFFSSRRRHTRYWRDWSSDVCSSDLGGQAGTSSKIENYLGFPTGISGQALAGRAQVQAQKFGARIVVPRTVERLDCDVRPRALHLDDGTTVKARAVVIATGARYRTLDLPNVGQFEGNGIHYAATAIEAALCANEEVIVVGGGNSTGQATVFLAGHAAHVH